MPRIFLIRHGETDYTKEKRFCGWSNPPLNKEGLRQAEKIAQYLKQFEINQVFSSDMERCRQTASIALNNRELTVSLAQELREINFGQWEGYTHTELMEKYPQAYQEWLDSPDKFQLPAGENTEEFKERVTTFFKHLLTCQGTTAVFTHGGPIYVVMNYCFQDRNFRTETGSINLITFD